MNKTDLFIERVETFKNKQIREKVFEKMSKNDRILIVNLIKNSLEKSLN
tara:strand:- start:2455 stop:2601 length:147 start_codon:yes stop_codon:yes gene_type:complete